ncbi:MAG: hypothetical protein IPH48_01170 [bacterium]|nr:hypothetical protein [bacterium]
MITATLRLWPRTARLQLLALAAFVLLGAARVQADLGPDVRIRLNPQGEDLPVAGQPFSFDVEITSASATTVSAPVLRTGRTPAGVSAWQTVTFLPTGFNLPAMQPVSFPVQLQCNDPAQPIEISLQVGSRTTMQRFYLLPQGLNSAIGGNETMMTFDSDKGPAVTPDDRFALPDPSPVLRKNVRDKRQPARAAMDKGRNIRVRGRFVYFRESHDSDYNYVGDGRTMGADGVTVSVYDSDWDWDELLARGSIGPDGYYDFTFYYDDDEAPDIYVEFLAANTKVDLVHPSIWNTSYVWNTPTKEDFGGTEINWGQRHPSSEDHYAGLNQLASATRGWRWLNDNGYGSIDGVLISWPDADWPHYKPIWETIYIPEFRQWAEDTTCHEYGHHWQQDFTETDGSDYCNPGGRCDEAGEDCRHCMWCEESSGDAMQEGFPNWFSQAITSTWPANYGFSSIFSRDTESIARCTDGGLNQFDDPNKTEGMIAAFLQDLTDSNNEVDPSALNGGQDVVTWSAQRILQAQGIDDPISPYALIASLRSRHPESADAIWMAAANNRFTGLDSTAPSALTGLASTSHATSGNSPDGTVELYWNASTDNYSGIGGYSVRVGSTSGLTPDTTIETTATNWESSNLAPGTYWFTVRAVDRGGMGGAHATFGPVTIRPFTPADVEASTGGQWPYPVVPRLSANATVYVADLSPVLVGNGDTYFNLRFANSGELTTDPVLRLNVYIDGALNWWSSIYPLEGYSERAYLNVGPWEVPGGRHAVRMWCDAYEQMPEADEADNYFTRQFIWYPYTLASNGSWVTRQRPKDAWGGFNAGLFSAPNCDGFSYTMGTDPFVGAVMITENDDSDFDLRLHTHTTGSTSGFGYFDVQAISNRPAGCLEAVFTNNSQTTETSMDVGVVNPDFDGYGFQIRRIFSTSMSINSDVQFPLSPIQPMALRHFTLPGDSGTNYGVVTLQVDPSVGKVRLKVLPADTDHAGLDDAANQTVTDANGYAKVTFTYGGATQALAVWQDPQDIPVGGSGHFQVTVRASVGPADFAPLVTTGWWAPLVPTNGAPGTSTTTTLPSTLAGNAASTYINVQFRNEGMATGAGFDSMTYLDGVGLVGEQISGFAALTNRIRNYPYVQTVRGGRHTLSMFPDATDVVTEGSETNNTLGLQYVWSPLALATGATIERSAPPPTTGGFAAAMAWSSAPLWFNCDGLRTPVPAPSGNTAQWLAVAALPGATSDVDLRLHERVNSSLQGFSTSLAVSGWGAAESDYLLVNFRSTTPRQFDVGALGIVGSENYRLQTVASSWLASTPLGDYGPFSLASTGVIALHEVWLPAGPVSVKLHQSGGDAIDWGLTLHRGQLPYHAKSATAGIVGQAWIGAAGADETMPVEVPQAGYYCLAVWKAQADDYAKAGQYTLRFDGFLSDAPGVGDVPAVTAVRDITPNPFNPATRIAFDLAHSGPVRLEIFDVRGRLVRRLVSSALEAGRHEVLWDGRDDQGVGAASGTYVARLRAAEVTVSRKMQLLK